ncbi:CDKN2AIP N-terminal-like protein [Ornithorhynchus anatinus]|uniref:CDKN2A interacting protein N-terminal like n=1 Tax=Ornithorhynchus anatinus TaxID=9258 RepID=A0A6I8NHM5_ORNAN|nr:CDKN2AIP N-terminal-like protein [Ornithorhynchus anatinus]
MVGAEAAAVAELVKESRQVAELAERFRAYSESEKHWKVRMEFILRHLADYRDPPAGTGGGGDRGARRTLDQLLALSMVWANHLFLGCSYNKDLLDKVIEMAEGIEVEDLPHFTTRDELMQKHQR